MRRGFIYSSSGARGSLQKGGTGSSNPERERTSLRKRQRSPDASVANLPGSSRQRQSTTAEGEGEDFLLDEIGSAALEQYELTQRQRSSTPSPIPKPQSPFSITATYTVPHSTTSLSQAGTTSTTAAHSANLPANRTQKWPSPYQTATGLQPSEASVIRNQPSSSTSGVAHTQEPLLHPNGENKELAGKIKELREQNFTKDGEVKVLRSEKERLLEELQKKERQLYDVTSQMQLEKRTREEQLIKESESLATQLKFSEQELKALQEKYAFLEQKQKAAMQQSSQQTSPLPLSRPPQKSIVGSDSVVRKGRAQSSGKDRAAEFLSTETFMPLSQMVPSDVTAVHIRQKRGSQSEQGSAGDGTALRAKSAKISSVSPTTVSAAKKQDKGASTTGVDVSSTSSSLRSAAKKQDKGMPATAVDVNSTSSSLSSGSRRVPARAIVRKDSKLLPAATRTFPSKDPHVVLDVPSTQLDGAGLLRLLVDPNLLKLPEFRAEDPAFWEEELPSCQSPVCKEYSTNELSPVVRAPPRKLIGLLSLLHPPVPTSPFPVVFPNMLMTPVSSHKSSESGSGSRSANGSYRRIPTFEASLDTTPKTPVRKPKIPLPKPHTCGRSDLSKAKTRNVFGAAKSLSAANTPVRFPPPDQQSASSLASSINTAGLEQSIASLLHSTDSSQFSAMVSRLSLSGTSPSPFGLSHSGDSCTLLLQHLGEIVIEYCNEQQSKAKASASVGNTSELGETLDSSTNSPKSSSSSSTVSSRDLTSPPAADQELVTQMLGLLETLVCYSRSAREQLLAKPPEFAIDSRPSSVMGHRSFVHSDEEDMEERIEPGREVASLAHTHPATSGSVEAMQSCKWRGMDLVPLQSGSLSSGGKVWVPRSHEVHMNLQDQPTPVHKATRGCGQLFSTILELTAPLWKESVENTVACLSILTSLAEDCPVERLEKFCPLLVEDSLGVCLDREDAQLTLTTLHLLTHMARSTTIVSMLCGHGDPCTLDTCYQCFMDPPPGPAHIIHRIHTQLCRLISSIMCVSNGPQVLFESTTCRCSHELLKSVVLLLNELLDDVHQLEQLSQQDRQLVCELLSLLHKVSVFDRYFDSHREDCKNTYAFVLNSLCWLLKDTPAERELPLVNDLLEYCEELEDSQDNDSAAGEEERMDEQ